MKFHEGKTYTREQIHAKFGGSLQSYLPTRDGIVVCGCFSPDLNPDAPEEILVGDAPNVLKNAKTLVSQEVPIPIFLKKEKGSWIYKGKYRASGSTMDPRVLREKEKAARREDVKMAIQFEPFEAEAISEHCAYLLTWNPKRWDWTELHEIAHETRSGRLIERRWSSGRNKSIPKNSRVFLLRQGSEPKGIMASGFTVSAPFSDEHWDENQRLEGKEALFVKIKFDRVLDIEDEDPLSTSKLRGESGLGHINWDTQSSGISLGADSAEIERLWNAHINSLDQDDWDDEEATAIEGEQKRALVFHRQRERKLRKRKIEEVMRSNGGRLICEVKGCKFDFWETYGSLGKGFAHVHHLQPLGDRDNPSLTSTADLAIVCANCHAMIHRHGGNRTLETLLNQSR